MYAADFFIGVWGGFLFGVLSTNLFFIWFWNRICKKDRKEINYIIRKTKIEMDELENRIQKLHDKYISS